MLRIAETLESQLRAAMERAFPDAAAAARQAGPGLDPQLAPASKPEFGDFQANGALPLAKPLGQPPRKIAEAVDAGADGVLLDEFSPEALLALVPQLRQRAASRAGAAPVVLEASGVQPEQLSAYAATGIDLISTSAPVTRSRWLDLSMRFDA